MNRAFSKWLVIGLGLIVVLLLVNAGIAYRNTRQLHNDAYWVAHTHEVLNSLDELLTTVLDAETGQRGFLITGREDYLKPYEASLAAVDVKIERIKGLTEDNDRQQARIPRLQELIRAKLDELNRTVALRRGPGFEAAQKEVLTDFGKNRMDEIRSLVAEMQQDEQRLLRERQEANDQTYQWAFASGGLVAFVGLVAVSGFTWVLRSHLCARQKAAAVIYEQQERLRTTLASIGDAVIATDTKSRVTFLNPIAESLTGWTQDAAKGTPLLSVFKIVNEQSRKPVEDPTNRALREGTVVGLANHTVLIAKDGSERPIDDSAAPIRDERGRVIGVVLVFRDVTERKLAEKSARFLASIVESSDDAIIGKDVNGIITSWNPAAERLYGYSAAEVVGRPVAILAPLERADEMPSILARIKRGERVDHFDTVRRAKDGRLLPISLTVSPIRNEDGLIIGASKIARDISERRQAEEVLQQEKERLHATLNGIGDAVIVTDAESRCTLMNPVAQGLTGWKDEATGRPLEDVFRIINEQTRQPVSSPVSRALSQGLVVGLANHTVLIAKDGTERPIDDSAAPIRDSHGHVFGCVLVFRDVTERRRMEQSLKDADRRKDEFLATLAHELRNPLAPVRNAVELLSQAGDDPSVREEAHRMMQRQLGHMVRLIDDLMDISRVTSGKLQLRKERVELATTVQSAVEETRPLIEASAHELTVNLPPEPLFLDADPTRLSQVFSNLISNAAKYTDKGGHIWVTAERRDGDISVSVRDTGIGIPAEHLAHIFEMFSQVTPALDRSNGGLGIGLALVRGLVELHGGTVGARSAGLGMGSEFIIRLPVLESRIEASAERPADGQVKPQSGLKRRILVVDDNADSATSLALLLRRMGHEIETAHDGLEAVQAAAAFRPQVVLLDIGLPKMNGYEAAKLIRKQPSQERVAIIALTGWGQERDKQRAYEAGIDHHLTKPVEHATLEKLLALIAPS